MVTTHNSYYSEYGPGSTAAALMVLFSIYILTAIVLAPAVARHKTGSNKRARMGACPLSSASAAANSPATDHAARTATKNASHGATPDPRPTPLAGGWVRITSAERANYSRTPSTWCAHDAGDRAPQTIPSPQDTPSPEARGAGSPPSSPSTGPAAADTEP